MMRCKRRAQYFCYVPAKNSLPHRNHEKISDTPKLRQLDQYSSKSLVHERKGELEELSQTEES